MVAPPSGLVAIIVAVLVPAMCNLSINLPTRPDSSAGGAPQGPGCVVQMARTLLISLNGFVKISLLGQLPDLR
jgi:hypothetical protein